MSLEEYKLIHLYKSSNPRFILPTKTFFNLSSEPALSSLNSTFNLGLKHIPIPQNNQNKDILSSLNRTLDSIGWQIYYARRKKQRLLKDEHWNPAFGRFLKKELLYPHPLSANDPATQILKTIRQTVTRFLDDYPAKRTRNTELNVLRQLKRRYPLIIFTASDKNLGLVALDLPIYNQMILSHLNNNTTYHSMGPNSLINFMDNDTYNNIKHSYQQLQQYLLPLSNSAQETRLLSLKTNNDFTVPKFHVLPKLTRWCENNIPVPLHDQAYYYQLYGLVLNRIRANDALILDNPLFTSVNVYRQIRGKEQMITQSVLQYQEQHLWHP